MATRAKLVRSTKRTPSVVEQQRLAKIAEGRRALRQEKQIRALARQIRAAITRSQDIRIELARDLAGEFGFELVSRGEKVEAVG
jgi:hypothetical protein